MATNPATSTDLSNRSLRTLSTQELSVGTTLLTDAWNLIITEVPTIPGRLDLSPSLEPLVVQVQCAMVLRVLNNPNGKLEEAVDDYSVRFDSSVSRGALYLSPDERDLLGRGDDASDNAFTIRAPGQPFWAPASSTDIWR